MRYLTARKRAEGRGASGTGTAHHWYMSVSAAGLAVMVPTFLIIFGRALGRDYDGVLETFAQPFVAILTAMVLVVGLQHFRHGAETLIDDYVRGTNKKVAIIFVITFTYFLMATGLYALARMAL
jgi:succinate dehydrogenase / fumarate reductase membrane anchor subunit